MAVVRAPAPGLSDVAVVLDAEVSEVTLVGAANAIDNELVMRDVVQARHGTAVVQGDVLFFSQVDRELHCIAEADLLCRLAPAVSHEERDNFRSVARSIPQRQNFLARRKRILIEALLEASRREAEDLIRAAQDEYEKLRSRSTGMRTRLREAEAAMNALAVETLPKLEAVTEEMNRPEQRPAVEVTVVPDAVVGLEMLQDMSSADMDFDAAVDLLLAQFREADSAGIGRLATI